MFCDNCGSELREGSKFCLKCGARLPGADAARTSPGARPTTVIPAVVAAPAQPPVQPPPQDPDRKKGAGAFFSSPGGIVLIVAIALLVLGGITVGIVFAVSGGGNSKVDAATMDAWAEYENIIANDGKELAEIKVDPTALTANQEALKKSQENLAALQKDLARTGGSEKWRANPDVNPVSTRDVKAAQLAAAMDAYNAYIVKMNEFFGQLIAALTGNLLIDQGAVNTLNATLAEVQDLASKAKTLAGKFVKDNDQLAVADLDTAVFKASNGIATAVTNSVKTAQAAEQQRLTTEKASADQAAAAAAAQAAEQQRQAAEAAARQNQFVTCPLCGGVGSIEGGDGRYVCPFCGGSGTVTAAKAASFNPSEWAE